jgi:hypothetical protein
VALALGAATAPRLAAQDPAAPAAATAGAILARRHVVATRLGATRPAIDGRLDDAAWNEAPPASQREGPYVAADFVQRVPRPGAPASLRTEARLRYDEQALYVAVRLYDGAPDSILAPLLRRDDEGQSDWVFIEFDSRHDRRTAFSFGVNPHGIQADGSFANDNVYDPAWDGVWEAAACIDSLGWTAEFRIPFSQLPHGATSSAWGLNVYRYAPHRGEVSNWSPRLPALAGVVSHFNDLMLTDLPRAHLPVEIVPYAAARAGRAAGPEGAAAAGGDLRIQLTPGLQLRAAVAPDFGQVEADPSLVNLTAFQTFFPEQRPLFVQGADAFGFGRPLAFATRDLSFGNDAAFYSRRVGQAPEGTVPDSLAVVRQPGGPAILGAAKLSGRMGSWTVGVLDAWTASERALVSDATGSRFWLPAAPTTHTGVFRAVMDWRAGQSAAGILASIVQRVGMTPALAAQLPRAGLVLGLDGRHRFAGGRYQVDGALLGSRVAGSPAAVAALLAAPEHNVDRPDAPHLAGLRNDTTGRPVTGILADARVAKVGGGVWTWELAGHVASPGFDMNQAGFMRSADWLLVTGTVQYQRFPAGRIVQRVAVGSSQSGVGWSFGGERRATVLNAYVSVDFGNFWGAKVTLTRDLSSLATEYLRGGPALELPSRTQLAVAAFSDQRRATLFQLQLAGSAESETGSASWSATAGVDARLSPAVEVVVTPSVGRTVEGWQYVGRSRDAGGAPRYVVGRLTEPSAALTVRATMGLSPRLSLQLYAQPFVSTGRFDRYGEVTAPRARLASDRVTWLGAERLTRDAATGAITADASDPARSFTFDAADFSRRDLNASLVLRWEFRPGSTLFLVWTQARHDGLLRDFSILRDAGRLLGAPPANVFLVKVTYWLST